VRLLRTTVKDIARHAGVSPATVSLVLQKSSLVAEATRARIQSSIDSLGYVYYRAAANLRTRLTHTVGLVVCEITNPFYAELTAGIDDVLDRAGWVAFLANTAESPARQNRFIARMREQRVDGILLAPAEGTSPRLVDDLRQHGVPVVQMLRRLGRQRADHVSADFRLGMTLAAEHLIRLGHQRIAFVGGARLRRMAQADRRRPACLSIWRASKRQKAKPLQMTGARHGVGLRKGGT
jgi:LacI family transcriptional regulator